MNSHFLTTSKAAIVDAKGRKVMLKGVNFGGWLMMEAYFMHAPNRAEQIMKKEFAKTLGIKALADLEESFIAHFITEEDMQQVAAWGFNSVRLPFNYRNITVHGPAYLDKAVEWANKYGVYLILDLHAAPGSQNHDWHSDSLGKAELWTKKSNRQKTYELWEKIADRYKEEPMIAGYDLLNESVTKDTKTLNEFYRKLVKVIRRVDRKHILFIEGNRWGQDLSVLEDFKDDNWVYSIHSYEPLDFTFNFVPHLKYPVKTATLNWDKDTTRRHLENYRTFAQERGRPVHVGEFGVNYREGLYKEDRYVKEVVKCFSDYDFHWNYWTYKAVKHYMFPDGIFSYYPNPAWVHRPGPVSGWNRWKDLWPEFSTEMIASWHTKNFTLNDKILAALQ